MTLTKEEGEDLGFVEMVGWWAVEDVNRPRYLPPPLILGARASGSGAYLGEGSGQAS